MQKTQLQKVNTYNRSGLYSSILSGEKRIEKIRKAYSIKGVKMKVSDLDLGDWLEIAAAAFGTAYVILVVYSVFCSGVNVGNSS